MDDIYSAVGRMYEKDRLDNADILERRRREIYKKIPRIHEIDDIFSQISLQMARIALTNKDAMQEKLEEYKKTFVC